MPQVTAGEKPASVQDVETDLIFPKYQNYPTEDLDQQDLPNEKIGGDRKNPCSSENKDFELNKTLLFI